LGGGAQDAVSGVGGGGPHRLCVFGASGGTGRWPLEQALGGSHQVTAVTRRPASIPPRNGLRVVGTDVADADAVDAPIAGTDAVLSALGVSYSRKPITVYSQGTTNITAAMHRHGVKRLVVVSSAPLDSRALRTSGLSPCWRHFSGA
jgi:putative NADH-flavin reductase